MGIPGSRSSKVRAMRQGGGEVALHRVRRGTCGRPKATRGDEASLPYKGQGVVRDVVDSRCHDLRALAATLTPLRSLPRWPERPRWCRWHGNRGGSEPDGRARAGHRQGRQGKARQSAAR